MTLRRLKKQITDLLQQGDLKESLSAIALLPPRQAVNPLFGFLYNGDMRVRWHAVAAMGVVVSQLADQEMEKARVIMRRLMWNLNDESGGIGWGSPEAMGEILACHERLASEYAGILISYLDPDGNFLEHEGLQQGLLWGIGRLAHARPQLAEGAAALIQPFLSSSIADLRGPAVWAVGPILNPALREHLKRLCSDRERIHLFLDRRFVRPTIGELAAAALGCKG